MASNKNQHFVPRCYLKPFTLHGEGAAIDVYNIDRQKIIPNAPTKNQCSRDYFYGKDDQLEGAIQALEKSYGATLRAIVTPGYKLQAEHQHVLQLFWLFQYLRTEGACMRSAQMFAEMLEPVDVDNSYSMSIKEAVQAAMHAFAENMEVISDLKVCLLKNSTNVPFITSDDPAVLTNRWQLEDKRTRGGSLGLTDAGAIFLLPLSPKIYCIGYDPDVYSISGADGWFTIRKASDVEALNEFQLINCRANLYPGAREYSDALHNFVRKLVHRRPKVRHLINFAVFDGEDNGDHKRYKVVSKSEFSNSHDGIMHAQTIFQSPSQWPKFLMRRHKSVAYYNGTGLGYVRKKHTYLDGFAQPFFKVAPYK